MKYRICKGSLTIDTFKGDSCFLSTKEKERYNFIESVSPSVIDKEQIYIHLSVEPTMIVRSIRNDIWIGEPSCFSKNEYEILWPKLNEVEQVATEIAQVYDETLFKDFVRAV